MARNFLDTLRTLMEEDFEDIQASGFAPLIEEGMQEQGLLDFDEPGSGSQRW